MARWPLLRKLNQRLRKIEYYSAKRPRNRWTRAQDASLFITLLLSVPATWVCDAMVSRPVQVSDYGGVLSRRENGSLSASLKNHDKTSTTLDYAAPESVPIGVFRVELIDHHHGWPLTTTVRRQPTRVDLDLRIEPAPRNNAMLAMDDPLRLAIVEALKRDGQQDMVRAWPAPDEMPPGRSGVDVRRNWIWWIAASAVWWVVMVFATGALIQTLRFGATLVFAKRHARRAQLRAEGKCHSCGYDMTGLEFNERCPECGELVW